MSSLPFVNETPRQELQLARSQVRQLSEQLRQYVVRFPNEKLTELWNGWREEFERIDKFTQDVPEVPVSLVGGTGAGKSSLINAIVGTRILPVSNNRACTSAVTQIGYAQHEFHARVEFISREDWEAEVSDTQEDIRDVALESDAADAAQVKMQVESIAREKLWPLYRKSPDDDISQFDPLNLAEDPKVSQFLDQGVTEFRTTDLTTFRHYIKQFLESKERFWPIVKAVTIRGPFPTLSDGVILVDLPGVNDPNEAREAVTRRHLKTCKFVWIVFNIKRALTKDTLSLMQSEEFLRQIVMDGRADTLTFVGTAADDIDATAAIEELGLDEFATDGEIIARRNEAVCEVVRSQLDELARRMAALAREQESHAAKLAARMKASRIFTVSSREYLILIGQGRSEATRLTTPETQILQLRDHLQQISAVHGVRAHAEAISRQLQTLLTRIQGELETHRDALRNQRELGERQRKELEAAIISARTFLERELTDARERFLQNLESSQEVLVERVSRAVERAGSQLGQTYRNWEQLHWGIMKATCKRGGVHTGTKGRYDFAADLAQPILNTISFAWADYFEDKLRTVLKTWTEKLTQLVDLYRQRLTFSFEGISNLPEGVLPALERNFDTTERVLKELLAVSTETVTQRIQEVQRSLYERIPEQVRENMNPAFQNAAKERGSGMKQRMAKILADYASEISGVMFAESRETILQGVRGLNDTLQRNYREMTDAVTRAANVVDENLSIGRPTMAAVEMEEEAALFEASQTFVESLSRPAA